MLRFSAVLPLLIVSLTSSVLLAWQDDAAAPESGFKSYVDSRIPAMNRMSRYVPSDLLGLLQYPQYADQFNLTADQRKTIQEARMEQMQASQKASAEIMKYSQSMRKRQMELQKRFTGDDRPDAEELKELQKEMQEMQQPLRDMQAAQEMARANAEAKVVSTLSEKQVKRVLQVQLQSALRSHGITALAGSQLAELLNLTVDQKKKLVEKQIENQKELQLMMESLREELEHEALSEVLTPSQLEKLDGLRGESFKPQMPDYTQLLRQQVLGERPSAAGGLLRGLQNIGKEIKRDLDDDAPEKK